MAEHRHQRWLRRRRALRTARQLIGGHTRRHRVGAIAATSAVPLIVIAAATVHLETHASTDRPVLAVATILATAAVIGGAALLHRGSCTACERLHPRDDLVHDTNRYDVLAALIVEEHNSQFFVHGSGQHATAIREIAPHNPAVGRFIETTRTAKLSADVTRDELAAAMRELDRDTLVAGLWTHAMRDWSDPVVAAWWAHAYAETLRRNGGDDIAETMLADRSELGITELVECASTVATHDTAT